jgi:HNH endonuclease
MRPTTPTQTSRRVRCHPMPSAEALQKLWGRMDGKFVVRERGCWEWIGAKTEKGYGYMAKTGTTKYAHRISYWFHLGEIPDGLQPDHVCRNRACINPSHLEPVTSGENTRRGSSVAVKLSIRSCAKGHPFDGRNTGIRGATGHRYCKQCHREHSARFRLSNPAKWREIKKNSNRRKQLCPPN